MLTNSLILKLLKYLFLLVEKNKIEYLSLMTLHMSKSDYKVEYCTQAPRFEPPRDNTCLQRSRQSETQTSLLDFRD